jgi:hypothetical protein
MRLIRVLVQAAVLLVALFPRGVAAQVVFSEDFESPDTGNYTTYFSGQSITTASHTWRVTLNSVDLFEDAARSEAAASDGGQAIDLTGSPGAGVMEADFATTPGMAYELIFHFARNNLLGAEPGVAVVEIEGAGMIYRQSFRHDPASYPFNTYIEFQGLFLANSAQSTLRFKGLNPGVAGITIDEITISETSTTGVGSPGVSEQGGEIVGAAPNPFRPSVSIEYEIRRPGPVALVVYDVGGRAVRTLVRGPHAAGRFTAMWNGARQNGGAVAPGVYLCVLTTPEGTSRRRIVRVR